MTKRVRIQAFLAAAAVCLPVAGCGDADEGDPIPAGKAQDLSSQLDSVQSNVSKGLCDEATTAVDQARSTVDSLNQDGVGEDVQDALGDGVDNLDDLVRQDCQPEEEATTVPETTPTETETTPTETTPTETTPTETTPTETTPPSPTEPEPLPGEEQPPDEGDGAGQFDPNAKVPPGKAKKLKDAG